MKAFEQLKQDIIPHAGLGSPEATGFYAVHCPICKKSDKKTGGWKFEHDKIIYNCFRASCDASTVYEEGNPVPRKIKRLCEEYGVKIPPELLMVRTNFHKELEKLNEELYKEHTYKQVPRPDGAVPFDEGSKELRARWGKFFDRRRCSTDDVFLMESGDYKGCAVIGIRFFDKLVGYQYVTKKETYVAHNGGNSNLLDTPWKSIPNTVIVVEVTLDAKCFPNTVAVLKSKITTEQAFHLRGKRVIMLPDRTGNGMISQVQQYGWEIALPDWDAKDLNEAVQKYGVMVAAKMLMDSVYSDKLKAETKYRIWRWRT